MRVWVFPGQGSQRAGMGAELFDRFPELVATADDVLGRSVRELCLSGPEGELADTRWAQPAIFVVNALAHRAVSEREPPPDYLAGHSLGEYNALLAAECFDFATGLRLVRRRGELMGEAAGGGMAAVVGLDPDEVTALLHRCGVADRVQVANENSVTQVVVSGEAEAIRLVRHAVRELPGKRCVPLAVSAAFHSRYMADAARRFGEHLAGVVFRDPAVPVIANATAAPYPVGGVAALLARQIDSPVLWRRSMRELIRRGVTEAREVGDARVLTPLWQAAVAEGPEPDGAAAADGPGPNGAELAEGPAPNGAAVGRSGWDAVVVGGSAPAAPAPAAPAANGRAQPEREVDPDAAALGSARFRRPTACGTPTSPVRCSVGSRRSSWSPASGRPGCWATSGPADSIWPRSNAPCCGSPARRA